MAKVYIEEVEELSVPGVTNYSLVRGMEFFDAYVRASGIDIRNRDGSEVDGEELHEELRKAMNDYLIKETGENYG
jgi:hypothetical protein